MGYTQKDYQHDKFQINYNFCPFSNYKRNFEHDSNVYCHLFIPIAEMGFY